MKGCCSMENGANLGGGSREDAGFPGHLTGTSALLQVFKKRGIDFRKAVRSWNVHKITPMLCGSMEETSLPISTQTELVTSYKSALGFMLGTTGVEFSQGNQCSPPPHPGAALRHRQRQLLIGTIEVPLHKTAHLVFPSITQ